MSTEADREKAIRQRLKDDFPALCREVLENSAQERRPDSVRA